MINFFNQNSGAIQATSTIVLVMVTFYYAWQTRKTVVEMQSSRKDARLPIVRLSVSGPITSGSNDGKKYLDLNFENIGYGLASNIKIKIPTQEIVHIGNLDIKDNGSYVLYLDLEEDKKLADVPQSDKVIILSYDDIFGRNVKTLCIYKNTNEGTDRTWVDIDIVDWKLIQ